MTSVTTEPPALLCVEDTARLLNVGRPAVYNLIRTHRLRSLKIGRRRLIPRDAIAETIAALAEEASL